MGYYLKSDAVSLNTLATVFTTHLKARGVKVNKATVVSALLPAIKQLRAEGVLTRMEEKKVLRVPDVMPLSITQELKGMAAGHDDWFVTIARKKQQGPTLFQEGKPAKTLATLPLPQFVGQVVKVEDAMGQQFGTGNFAVIVTDAADEFVKQFDVTIGE